MKPSHRQNDSLSSRDSSLKLSPISKLLGNRPAVVESFVSKVDAISFLDGTIPSNHHHQLHLQQQQQNYHSLIPPTHRSPKLSSARDLIHSPPNDFGPHSDEFVRDTPTIRQLKTSLRSRLKTDSDRGRRISEDSGKSGGSDNYHRTPNDSPNKYTSQSLSPRQASITALSIVSVPSSSSHSPSASTSANRSSDIPLAFTPLKSPFHPPSIVSSGDSPLSVSASSSPTLHHQQKIQLTNKATLSIGEVYHAKNDESDPRTPTLRFSNPKPSIDLPELCIPLTNFHLSPPKLALWSLEAYERSPTVELSDLAGHLITLPLHTALAITKKLPILHHLLDPTPLSHLAEKENQGILITATQVAIGLIFASGWQVAKKLVNPF